MRLSDKNLSRQDLDRMAKHFEKKAKTGDKYAKEKARRVLGGILKLKRQRKK